MPAVARSGPSVAGLPRGHGFHSLRIRRVIAETADASSFVLDVPEDLRESFAYQAGQFCTFRVHVGGETWHRCYSMSSSPAVDDELAVTVKRVTGGAVSNWMIDALVPGATVDVSPPSGVFCLAPGGDIVAFAGGSGITPVFSLMKAALATTSRRVRLLYANRGPGSVIFEAALDELVASHPDRLDVVHHLDTEQGMVTGDEARAFVEQGADGAEFYICGPQPFMDVVEEALLGLGVPVPQIHIERFTPPPSPEAATGSGDGAGAGDEGSGADRPAEAHADEGVRVTVHLEGRTAEADYRPGTTILQTARQLDLSPPYSCESGNCATCMAKLVCGEATMYTNNALTEDEVAEGWILTCQAVPVTSVEVVYGYGEG